MIEVENSRNKQALLDIYRDAFKKRFGDFPIIDLQTALEIMKWANETFKFERAKELIRTYLQMNDEWIEQQAFPLEIFKKQINRVIASNGPGHWGEDWLVGFTETGIAVYSKNRDVLKQLGFNPVPWEEYEQDPDSARKECLGSRQHSEPQPQKPMPPNPPSLSDW